jgi:hypothetical protein
MIQFLIIIIMYSLMYTWLTQYEKVCTMHVACFDRL